nr:carbohydrate-binding domain-containing protein [Siccirubricoccus soli]
MDSRSEVWAPSQSVTVSLGQVADEVTVYDPLRGTYAISHATNTDRVTVEVTDHPVIIEISDGHSAPAAPPPGSGAAPQAGSTTIGDGSHALVLKVSQDRYQGDAQYTISVDGVQQGGTLTAQARAGSGETDLVTVKGDWSDGPHSVSVNFLNDAYGGSPDADRNLHVEGISYDGAEVSDGTATLLSNGAREFALPHATADWAL